MNAFDILRMSIASAASVGAAVGGFAASQNDTAIVGAAPLLPPDLERLDAFSGLVTADLDYSSWSEAFGPALQTDVNLNVQAAEWRFVGVIASGSSAKAIFSDPKDSASTLFVAMGDTLPDGRQVAKITSSEVFFAAPSQGEGPSGPSAPRLGKASLALFSGPSVNSPAGASDPISN